MYLQFLLIYYLCSNNKLISQAQAYNMVGVRTHKLCLPFQTKTPCTVYFRVTNRVHGGCSSQIRQEPDLQEMEEEFLIIDSINPLQEEKHGLLVTGGQALQISTQRLPDSVYQSIKRMKVIKNQIYNPGQPRQEFYCCSHYTGYSISKQVCYKLLLLVYRVFQNQSPDLKNT